WITRRTSSSIRNFRNVSANKSRPCSRSGAKTILFSFSRELTLSGTTYRARRFSSLTLDILQQRPPSSKLPRRSKNSSMQTALRDEAEKAGIEDERLSSELHNRFGTWSVG